MLKLNGYHFEMSGDRTKYRLNNSYIYGTIILLMILAVYYYHRFLKYYDRDFIIEFNLSALMIFMVSGLMMVFALHALKRGKVILLSSFSVLALIIILSHDFIVPYVCSDCKMNILVGKRFQEQGLAQFLRNYHKPTLYKIRRSPVLYEKFLLYDDILGLNYRRLMENIEDEPSNIILSEDTQESRSINWRIGKHSPLWFILIGLIEPFTGRGYFHKIIIPANLVAILYLLSLYLFLGLFYKGDEYREKLSILSFTLLMPSFLTTASQITNDLALGFLLTWVFYFLLKNNRAKVHIYDAITGLLYSLAVLCKFTSLTMIPLITILYMVRFRARAIPKLGVVFLCFGTLPVILYIGFGYDMILNVITGSVEEYTLKAIKAGTILNPRTFAWYILYELYHFGIPIVALLFTHIHKIKYYVTHQEWLISYIFIAFFWVLPLLLWGSGVSRHLLGFLPLMMPLLAHIYKNCDNKERMLLSTVIFLLVNNLLVLIHEGIIMAGFYHDNFNTSYWSY